MMLYFLDLLGTMAFAVSGAYHARSTGLNIFATVLLGTVTAVGGGTVRDLIIGRTPLFYLIDSNYFLVCIFAGVCTYLIPSFFKKNYSLFRFVDSIGLAVFVIIGASVCHSHLFPLELTPNLISAITCIFTGVITGVGGGVIRNAMMGSTPFAFKSSNYISSGFWGALIYYFLLFYSPTLAILSSFLITMLFREVISEYGVYKRVVLKKPKAEGSTGNG